MKKIMLCTILSGTLLLTACTGKRSQVIVDRELAEPENGTTIYQQSEEGALQSEEDEQLPEGNDRQNDGKVSETGMESGSPSAEKAVTQQGPYGSLTVMIPDGWQCDLLPVDDERLMSGNYGFHIYPEGTENGYVELAYHTWFGVCGTGLVQEEITLAGDTASVGYYDGSADWSFVIYQGKNEKIVALASSDTEGWLSEYQDQIMDILDSLQYDPYEQSGAIGVYDADSEISSLGIAISAKQISKTQATVVIRQYEPEIDAEMWFGEEFQLEKRDGDDWIAVPLAAKGEYGFNDIAYMISLDDTTEHEYNWEWLYGSLAPGEYRIGIQIYARGTGVDEEYPVYAHFIIR